MDSTTIIYCGAAFLILIGVYKLGYYVGHNDGIEDGAQIVLDAAAELWDQLISMSKGE